MSRRRLRNLNRRRQNHEAKPAKPEQRAQKTSREATTQTSYDPEIVKLKAKIHEMDTKMEALGEMLASLLVEER